MTKKELWKTVDENKKLTQELARAREGVIASKNAMECIYKWDFQDRDTLFGVTAKPLTNLTKALKAYDEKARTKTKAQEDGEFIHGVVGGCPGCETCGDIP